MNCVACLSISVTTDNCQNCRELCVRSINKDIELDCGFVINILEITPKHIKIRVCNIYDLNALRESFLYSNIEPKSITTVAQINSSANSAIVVKLCDIRFICC